MNRTENNESEHKAQQEEMIIFYLGDSNFAVDLMCVRELICATIVTRIKSDSDSGYCAMINFRGKLIRILDMQTLLGRSRRHTSLTTDVLIIEHKAGSGIMAGLIVDSIGEVIASGGQGHWEYTKEAGGDDHGLLAAELIKDGRRIELLNTGRLFETEFEN